MTNKPLTHSDVYDISKTTGAYIIGVNRLDDFAEKFLMDHCPEALVTPMPLPVEDMIEKAGLTIQTASLSENLDIFGCCMLLDGAVKIYDAEKKEYITAEFPAGTLLFDPDSEWAYGEGCKRNTLIHELIHWDKDKTYFKILELKNRKLKEKLYPIMCRQSSTYYEPPSGKKTKQNEVEWLEWQAHRLTPRVLMPRRMFIKKADELINSGISSCKELIISLADFFIVSKTSAKIRMKETGIADKLNRFEDYTDIFDIKSIDEHVPISIVSAYELMNADPNISKWISSNQMIFVDGYFVIPDKKYITVKNGQYHLSSAAKNNLSSCTLNICEAHRRSYAVTDTIHEEYAVLYHADGVDERFLFFHPDYQAGIKDYLISEKRNTSSSLRDITDDDVYEHIAKSLIPEPDETQKHFITLLSDPYTTLCTALSYWFAAHNIKYPRNFSEMTLLHGNYFNQIKNDKKNNMQLEMLMAICVGMKFDYNTTVKVLKKAGITLSEYNEPDRTYISLLQKFPGADIGEFNAILEKRGLKLLGSK